MIAGPIPILLNIPKNPNNTEAVATTPKSYGVSKRAKIIEIIIETICPEYLSYSCPKQPFFHLIFKL